MRILLVDDDRRMSSMLRRTLSREGYVVDLADTGEVALEMAGTRSYDAIVLDIGIPGPDGLAVCAELRGRSDWTPILMLTARHEISDKVMALDSGADDYVTKPFSPQELLARLRSLTRRQSVERPAILAVGDLKLDPASHSVQRGDVEIKLGPKEFSLLELLMRSEGVALSRREILSRVWDYTYSSNVVDVYVSYLRDKIDRPFGTSSIESVRGVGYMLTIASKQPSEL